MVSLHTSGSEKILGMEEIYRSDRKPFIVDTSRSEACRRSDLLSALREARIQGAASTVPDGDLRKGVVEKSLEPFLYLRQCRDRPQHGKTDRRSAPEELPHARSSGTC